jgi:hypothetical protein
MQLAETYKGYAKTIWERLSALATWQPDVSLTVGDIVTPRRGGVITRETTLAKLGVPADRLTCARRTAAPLREHSGVTITASGSAVVSSVGRARASFEGQSSFLIVTAQGWIDSMDHMTDARAVVEHLAARGQWGPDWHLVTSVRSYPACTIVIAKDTGVEAEVAVDLSAADLPILEAVHAGAQVGINSGHASQWVMPFDSTPFYQAISVQRRGLGRRVTATDSSLKILSRDTNRREAPEPAEEPRWLAKNSLPYDLGLL